MQERERERGAHTLILTELARASLRPVIKARFINGMIVMKRSLVFDVTAITIYDQTRARRQSERMKGRFARAEINFSPPNGAANESSSSSYVDDVLDGARDAIDFLNRHVEAPFPRAHRAAYRIAPSNENTLLRVSHRAFFLLFFSFTFVFILSAVRPVRFSN